MSAIEPLQHTVYRRLADSTALAELGCDVYDEVPEAAEPPYLVLGEFTEDAADSHTTVGSIVTVTMHAWSKYRGYRETARILDAADRALHRTRPTVDGYRDVGITVQNRQYQRDPDPTLRHGIARYEARLTRDKTTTAGELDLAGVDEQ
ncbi:Protein of unknown function [Actinopolyspora alba]|uniref:DUF3168 domain-containing protein n=1 Tax=Actinopolyspora alba TaxID=673379 RepID=A0A1I2BEQ7_9ACTN|nr:DUF3168 domain-containing protein [Actinopolyspora alba]SFE54635.1 Protein of unknown function [Actinopolyspora alba]